MAIRSCKTCGKEFNTKRLPDGTRCNSPGRRRCYECHKYSDRRPTKISKVDKLSDDDFIKIINDSKSYSECLNQIELEISAGNFNTLKRRIQRMELSVSHFQNKRSYYIPPRPIEEYLVENSTLTYTTNLKRRLLKEGYFKRKCYKCGITEWNGQPAPLELEHKNGIRTDNRLENLTILCSNCHAQTPTYRGKNVGKS